MPADWEAVVVERYVGGESGPAIAKGLGLPAERVYGVLRERGVLRSATEARKLEEARRRAAKSDKRQREGAPAGVDARVRAIPAEVAAVVVERYAAGESAAAIAGDLGFGAQPICRLLKERGPLRTPTEAGILREARRKDPGYVPRGDELVPAEVVAEVVERYRAGGTAPALAKAYGLKLCRVYKLLHEASAMRSRSEAVKLEQARRLAKRRER